MSGVSMKVGTILISSKFFAKIPFIKPRTENKSEVRKTEKKQYENKKQKSKEKEWGPGIDFQSWVLSANGETCATLGHFF